MEPDILTFFKGIRNERKELVSLKMHEADIRLSLLPGAIDYSRDKVQNSPDDPMLKMIERLEPLEAQTHVCEDKLIADLKLANDIISMMSTPEYRQVLRLRYIEGGRPMEWMEIAEEMCLDPVYLRGRFHGRAIAEARDTYKRLHEAT